MRRRLRPQMLYTYVRRLSYCMTAIRHLSLYCVNDRVSCTIDGIYRGTYKKVSTYSLPRSVINLSNLTSLCLKCDIGSLIPVQYSLNSVDLTEDAGLI